MHSPQLPHEQFDPDELYRTEHEDEPFEQGFMPPRDRSASLSCTVPPCPKCKSTRVDARHRARKAGGTIGTLAGTTSGIAFALSGAETGAAVGTLAGPAGAVCGAIAGVGISLALGSFAGTLFFGVQATDTKFMTLPGLTLLLIAALACLPAALKAIRTDPVLMLKSE